MGGVGVEVKSGRGFKDDTGVASNGFGVASLSRGEGGVILNICDGVFPLEFSIFFDVSMMLEKYIAI